VSSVGWVTCASETVGGGLGTDDGTGRSDDPPFGSGKKSVLPSSEESESDQTRSSGSPASSSPELGHEPLAAACPGLLSTRDGLAWDPEALSACKWESAEHS
jgi:hypothetical protein